MLCIELYILHINYVCTSLWSLTNSLERDRAYVIVVMQKGIISSRMSMLI